MGGYFIELSRRLGVPRLGCSFLRGSIADAPGNQFGMIATGYEKYGSQSELEKDAIKHLFDVYVKVNKDAEDDPSVKVEAAKWFKRMEDGDESALKNWRVWREMSVKKYEQEYERLNVKFDCVYRGEYGCKESMDRALEKLDEMGLISDTEGAKLVDLEKWKLGRRLSGKRGREFFLCFPFHFLIPFSCSYTQQTGLPLPYP